MQPASAPAHLGGSLAEERAAAALRRACSVFDPPHGRGQALALVGFHAALLGGGAAEGRAANAVAGAAAEAASAASPPGLTPSLYAALMLIALDLPPPRSATASSPSGCPACGGAGCDGELRAEPFGRPLVRPTALTTLQRLLAAAPPHLRWRCAKDLNALVVLREGNLDRLLGEPGGAGCAWMGLLLADVPCDPTARSPHQEECYRHTLALHASLFLRCATVQGAGGGGGRVDGMLRGLVEQLAAWGGWHEGATRAVGAALTAAAYKLEAAATSGALPGRGEGAPCPAALGAAHLADAVADFVALHPVCTETRRAGASSGFCTPALDSTAPSLPATAGPPVGEPGFHFDAAGQCADAPLVQRMLAATHAVREALRHGAAVPPGRGGRARSPARGSVPQDACAAALDAAETLLLALARVMRALDDAAPKDSLAPLVAQLMAAQRAREQRRGAASSRKRGLPAAMRLLGGGFSRRTSRADVLAAAQRQVRLLGAQQLRMHTRELPAAVAPAVPGAVAFTTECEPGATDAARTTSTVPDTRASVCPRCLEAVDASADPGTVTAGGQLYHAGHCKCSDCGFVVTAAPTTHRGRVLCCDCAATAAGRCAGCGRQVGVASSLESVTTLGLAWHTECFVCAHCAVPLAGGDAYEHADAAGTQQPYCRAHFTALFAPRCCRCSQPMSGRVVQLEGGDSGAGGGEGGDGGGSACHVECCTCEVCGTALAVGGVDDAAAAAALSTAFVLGGKLLCETHALAQLGADTPACSGCGASLLASEGDWVEALGGAWHPACYVCQACGDPLPPGGSFCVRESDGAPLHEACFVASCPACAACGGRVREDAVTVRGETCHRECLRCAECAAPLYPAGAFEGAGDALVCRAHALALHAPHCARCGGLIAARYVEVDGDAYHMGCVDPAVLSEGSGSGGGGGGGGVGWEAGGQAAEDTRLEGL